MKDNSIRNRWVYLWLAAGLIGGLSINLIDRTLIRDVSISQMRDSDGPVVAMTLIGEIKAACFIVWLLIGASMLRQRFLILLVLLPGCGLYRGYPPVDLQDINTSETAILIPLTGDTKHQEAFNSEELLKKNMVSVKQVQIEQRWVPTGYWPGAGKYVPSVRLVKVDRAPVTREWTADENSGSSAKNEAIWVMTSDSIEFSTGWTCTARIKDAADAVKFLFNYPTGGLQTVMDHEVRAKIQSEFGILVTDKPMDELRKNSSPVFKTVQADLTEFFLARGITITNLGITGGYVYKDKRIQETLNKVFQSQQETETAIAETHAQLERNKAVQLKATGLAEAAEKEATGKANAIKLVADANAYEIQQAKEDLPTYMKLKAITVEMAKISKWEGKFPTYFMGSADPHVLLTVPSIAGN